MPEEKPQRPENHALAFNDGESLWMRAAVVMELILLGLVMGFFGLIVWVLKKTKRTVPREDNS